MTLLNAIVIDQTKLPPSVGNPFLFDGVHSGGQLSGIEVEIAVYSDEDNRTIEAIFKKDSVTVDDPFTNRQYEATSHRKSSAYHEGRLGTTYRFEVKELDEAPQFEQLGIEGHTFAVLRNSETLDKKAIAQNMLLRLSPEEFQIFQSLIKPGAITIQRLGIDESPIARRFGGALYWSLHEEGSERFYKQIARFYPTDFPRARLSVASGIEQLAQSRMIFALTARYEALVKTLIENGHIGQESGETLMADEWRNLIDDERAVMMRSKLREVEDADLELD